MRLWPPAGQPANMPEASLFNNQKSYCLARQTNVVYNSSMSTTTAKQRALDAIKKLPDDASLEDLIERLCFLSKLEEGLQQSDAGEVVPHEKVKENLLS